MILRSKDKSDPDPKLATVILHIWPWMFLVTVANLVFLVVIAGLAGWLIFPALAVCYMANHLALSYFCKVIKPATDLEDGRETTEDNQDATEQETKTFIPMAALSSLWLPSVVGPQSQKIFLVSGITSLVSKVLLLVVAVALSEAGLLTSVHPKPFLLFCFNDNSPHLQEMTDVQQCHFPEHNVSEGDCFLSKNSTQEEKLTNLLNDLKSLEEYKRIVENIDDDLGAESIKSALFQNKTFPDLGEVKRLKGEVEEKLRLSGKLQQKVRICQKDETPFRLYILAGFLVVIALAAYATYRLHRIADYRVFEIKTIKYQYLFNLSSGAF